MKVLIKYLMKLSVIPFLVGLAGFIIFVSIEILYQLSDLIVRHRVGIEKLFLLLYYYLPYFVAMGVPVGVLLAVFWVFSKLSEDRELMAIQVHGISQKNLIVPFILLGSLLSIIVFFLNDRIVPAYQSKAEEAMSKYVLRKPEVFVVENVISKIGEDQYFYVEKYDEKTNTLWNVVIFKYGSEEKIVTAKRVQKKDDKWYLFDGRYYSIDKDGFLKLDVHFSEMELDITEDIENLLRVGKTPREMTGKELKEKINFFRKVGIKPSPWIVELHSRYANSLTPIVIVLVGVPLSLLFQLRSKSWGVIFTFVLVVLYQGSGAWLSAMGKENLLDPLLAPWIPNIVFTVVGGILFILLDTVFAYRIREFFTKLFVVGVFFLASSLFSAQLNIIAEKVNKYPDTFVFEGGVKILYKDAYVEANEVVVHLNEEGKVKGFEATGKVSYRKGDTFLKSERLVFKTEKEQSILYYLRGNTRIEVNKEKKQIYLSGEELTSEGSKTVMEKGYITTCSSNPPHYKLKAQHVEIVENEYLLAKDVVFYLLGIPIFYQPIFFTNLSDKPQPFSVEVGMGEEPYVKTSYNISYGEGNVFFLTKNVLKKGTWKELKWNHSFGVFSVNLEYTESLSEQGVKAKIFDKENSFLFEQENSKRVYQFDHNGKLFNGSISVRLKREANEGGDVLIAPQLTVKNLSIKADWGTFLVSNFYHETKIEKGERTFGTLNSSFRSKPFFLIQSFSVNTAGKYLFENSQLNRTTSFLKSDTILDFQNLSFGKILILDDKIYAGIYESSEEGYRIGNFFTTSLRLPIGPLSFESYYKLYTLQGKNLRKFSQNKAKNELDLKSKFSLGNLSISVETTYDFLKEEFSDPYLKVSSSFKTGMITNGLNATTRFVLDDLQKSYTKWEFTQKTGAVYNKLYFIYHYKKPHVQYIEDQLRIYGKEFFFMENPRITAYSKIKVDPFELERFWIRGGFKRNQSSHTLKAEFYKEDLDLSYEVKNDDPTFSVSLKLKDWNIESFSFSIEKSLHCLGAKASMSFGKNLSLKNFSLFFYIRDFPNEGIGFDTNEGIGLNMF
ncbi:LptF/LptG family permease [Thermotoga sp. KOL6]|uniref:YjgP/YjgQ family permease n=1 Tax=Thermotoga sp. KOL6 TaxID=126741 RepID=UPI000CBC6D1C|nr:LptF/LptG family permease [Thermotoga sp. KOL6]PLV60119.1 permease [Thermotoga sp. KOL6]